MNQTLFAIGIGTLCFNTAHAAAQVQPGYSSVTSHGDIYLTGGCPLTGWNDSPNGRIDKRGTLSRHSSLASVERASDSVLFLYRLEHRKRVVQVDFAVRIEVAVGDLSRVGIA